MMFWWLPEQQDRSEQPRAERGAKPAAGKTEASTPPRERAAEAPQPRTETAPAAQADDLTVLKGVGEAMQKKLRGQGINTFGDLAGADADELTARLKETQPVLSRNRVQEWIDAARQRSAH